MAVKGQESTHIYWPILLSSIALLALSLYWNSYEVFCHYGLAHPFIESVFEKIVKMNLFENQYTLKGLSFLFLVMTCVIRSGKTTDMKWATVLVFVALGAALFFIPYMSDRSFLWLTLSGYVVSLHGWSHLGRKLGPGKAKADNDLNETFQQCDEKIVTEYSINIPTEYQWEHRRHRGWINIVNPFRASLIMGTPGSGKSFSIYYEYIDQMMRKGMPMFVYDYKMPDLTILVYNKWLQYFRPKWDEKEGRFREEKGVPQFCIINFDNPRQSMRCNPLNARYLTDMTDAHEVADLIMKNINPKSIEHEDFFSMSAKVYIASLVWYLRIKDRGIYCTFPHLIELMGADYTKVLEIMQKYDELQVMLQPFASAWENKAMEQLMGQIASAQIPLLRFPSKALYWTLTGDDFTLDYNNPDAMRIICIGNNPDRQSIYGTALSLYTSRMFKVINHKKNKDGKRNAACGVLLDELPTVFINGLDNLIATARSNRVAIALGVQDLQQLTRDYTKTEADVIFNTVGTYLSGQVNFETAKMVSTMFGQEFRMQVSDSSGDSDSVSHSFQKQEILPPDRIMGMSQGVFCGRVADDNEAVIERKLFCGRVLSDVKARIREEKEFRSLPDFGAHNFDDKGVEIEVMGNPEKYIKEYFREKIEAEEWEKKKKDRGYKVMDMNDMYLQARKMYDEVRMEGGKEYEEVLKKTIRVKQDEMMNRMLDENYARIKEDIRNIIREELGEEDEEQEQDGNDEEEEEVEDDENEGGYSGEDEDDDY